MALRPLKTFVRLNRKLGNSQNRHNDPVLYQMIIPIKLKNGTFIHPATNDNSSKFYLDALKEGNTILLHENGISWNTLCQTDFIIEIYQS